MSIFFESILISIVVTFVCVLMEIKLGRCITNFTLIVFIIFLILWFDAPSTYKKFINICLENNYSQKQCEFMWNYRRWHGE